MIEVALRLCRLAKVYGFLVACFAFTASDLPVHAQAATYYLHPEGDNRNSGTQAEPWKTLKYALTRLSSGDTLYLRGGTYWEANIQISDLQGAAGAPITVTNYPGEQPILDGGFAEFRAIGNADWEVHDGARGVYRSKRTYPGLTWIKGKIDADGELNALVPYKSYAALAADGEVISKSPYYMGPGLFYDRATGRIYIRLKWPDPKAVLRTFTTPSNPDPRQNQIYLWPENVLFEFSNAPSAHLVFKGVDFWNYSRVVDLANASHHLTWANFESRHQGFLIARGGAHDLLIDDALFLPVIPRWLPWKDMKCVDVGEPAKEIRYSQIAASDGGFATVEFRNSTVDRAFDVAVIVGASHDIRFHHNTFYVYDDSSQTGSNVTNYEFDHNLIFGPGISHNGFGQAGNGTKYVHHNIVDVTKEPHPLIWSRQDAQALCDPPAQVTVGDRYLRPFPSHGGSGVGGGDPWQIYNNTVITAQNRPGLADPGLSLVYGINATGVPHRALNNILVVESDVYAMRGAQVDNTKEIHDGNVYWHSNSSRVLFLDFSGQNFATLEAFLKSSLRQNTCAKGWCWDAQSLQVDPQLDENYVPRNPAVLSGGVDFSSANLPGWDGIYRGAIKPGTNGSNIGDPESATPPPGGEVVAAVNAGGGAYTALDGTAYTADAHFSGGKKFSTTAPIAGTEDDTLYQGERYAKALAYDIPVGGPGDYAVTLQFAEIFFTAPGQRVFDVALEGAVPAQLDDLDLVARAGPNAAYDVTVPVTVGADGVLDIDLTASVNNAKVNAIRVVAAGSGVT
jgi:hypothetical protein